MTEPETMREKIFYILAEKGAETGLSDISLNDIATQAGIKKPSLYNYWPSRDDMIHEFFLYWGEKIRQIDEEELQRPFPPQLALSCAESILLTVVNNALTLFSTYPYKNIFMIADCHKYLLTDAANLCVILQQTIFCNVKRLLETLVNLNKLKINDMQGAVTLFSCSLIERIRFEAYEGKITLKIPPNQKLPEAAAQIHHFISRYAPEKA